jgi:hypothetical protein
VDPCHVARLGSAFQRAERAGAEAAALRALQPKAAQHATQAAALGPLRARVGELQGQLSALDGEVRPPQCCR